MSTPAPRLAEDRYPVDAGWPYSRGPSVTVVPPPAGVAARDLTWAALALLGVVLGAVALIWFLSLNPSAAPAKAAVPSVVGMPEAAAVRRLTSDGFEVRAIEPRSGAARGAVVAQRPTPASRLRRGAIVTIRVTNASAP